MQQIHRYRVPARAGLADPLRSGLRGRAYNHGLYGAYGRLGAWQSMAGLSGSSTGAPAAEVERRAQACDWLSFNANTNWFDQVAWDFGLAAIWPGRRSLAVLAATDTD